MQSAENTGRKLKRRQHGVSKILLFHLNLVLVFSGCNTSHEVRSVHYVEGILLEIRNERITLLGGMLNHCSLVSHITNLYLYDAKISHVLTMLIFLML